MGLWSNEGVVPADLDVEIQQCWGRRCQRRTDYTRFVQQAVRISIYRLMRVCSSVTRKPSFEGHQTSIENDTILYDTILDAILTCAQKLTQVSLSYRTEPTTKKRGKCWKGNADMLRSIGRQSWKKEGSGWTDLQKGFKGDVWREWWVGETNGRSATRRTGWNRIGEISVWLIERSRELIPETRRSML